jgi:hypothetical protein
MRTRKGCLSTAIEAGVEEIILYWYL